MWWGDRVAVTERRLEVPDLQALREAGDNHALEQQRQHFGDRVKPGGEVRAIQHVTTISSVIARRGLSATPARRSSPDEPDHDPSSCSRRWIYGR
jgi:hypothetical protein